MCFPLARLFGSHTYLQRLTRLIEHYHAIIFDGLTFLPADKTQWFPVRAFSEDMTWISRCKESRDFLNFFFISHRRWNGLSIKLVAHWNTFETLIDSEMLWVVHHTQPWIPQIVLPLSCPYVLTIRRLCARQKYCPCTSFFFFFFFFKRYCFNNWQSACH